MHEFGIDFSGDTVVTPALAAKSDLKFILPRIGYKGYGGMGQEYWFNRPLTIDSGFLPSIRNVQNVGKPCGAYVFSYAWNDRSAIDEANRACDFLDANNVSLELPLFFDWEYDARNHAQSTGLPISALIVQSFTIAFMRRVVERGRRTGFYSNIDFLNLYYKGPVTAWRNQGYMFWLAQWPLDYNPGMLPAVGCDCWQWDGSRDGHTPMWNGLKVDKNRAESEAFLGKGKIPIWLLFKMSQENGVIIE